MSEPFIQRIGLYEIIPHPDMFRCVNYCRCCGKSNSLRRFRCVKCKSRKGVYGRPMAFIRKLKRLRREGYGSE
jgi:hypothetical protein